MAPPWDTVNSNVPVGGQYTTTVCIECCMVVRIKVGAHLMTTQLDMGNKPGKVGQMATFEW